MNNKGSTTLITIMMITIISIILSTLGFFIMFNLRIRGRYINEAYAEINLENTLYDYMIENGNIIASNDKIEYLNKYVLEITEVEEIFIIKINERLSNYTLVVHINKEYNIVKKWLIH